MFQMIIKFDNIAISGSQIKSCTILTNSKILHNIAVDYIFIYPLSTYDWTDFYVLIPISCYIPALCKISHATKATAILASFLVAIFFPYNQTTSSTICSRSELCRVWTIVWTTNYRTACRNHIDENKKKSPNLLNLKHWIINMLHNTPAVRKVSPLWLPIHHAGLQCVPGSPVWPESWLAAAAWPSTS